MDTSNIGWIVAKSFLIGGVDAVINLGWLWLLIGVAILIRYYLINNKDLLARIKEVEDLVSDNNNRVKTSTESTEKAFNFARYANYWLKNGDSNTKHKYFNHLV